MPPPRAEPTASSKDDEKIALDLDLGDGDDVEVALNAASTDEIVDLAGILGLHSMMNQVLHCRSKVQNASLSCFTWEYP